MHHLTLPRLLLLSALMVGSVPTFATPAPPVQAGPTLTLADAVERALGFRPEVASARAERRRAESGVAEARAALLPTVDALGSVTHHDEPVPVTPFHGFGADSFPDFETTLVQGSLQLGYTLWNGGRRAGEIDRAAAEAEVAGAGLDDTRQAVVARTVNTYLRVLTLGATLDAADARIEALQAERGRVVQLLEVGRAAEVDLRRAEAALAAARAERIRLTTSLETAEKDLGRLIGAGQGEPEAPGEEAFGAVPYSRLTPLDDSTALSPVPPRETLARALEANPRLLAEQRRLAAAEASVQVARGSGRPTLSAVSDFQELGSTQGTFEGEWSAGLRIAVPLFRGGALEERAVQAGEARNAVAQGVRATHLELEGALDAALAALERARARQEALVEAEEQYAEVARIERLRLETGVGIQADYLDAEASLLDARAGVAEAAHAEVAARVELARLTGSLDLGWIERELGD